MEIENQASFEQALRNGINLFAGAGFSVCAKSVLGSLPVGQGLVDALRERFPEVSKFDLELPEMYAFLNSTDPSSLEHCIRDWYRVTWIDPRYDALLKFPIRSIYTTNVDNIFQEVYRNSDIYYLNDLYINGATLHDRSAVNFAQLHGSVLDPGRNLVFGPLEIATAAINDQDRWRLLRQHVSSHPTLFWGYAMKDAGTLQSLRKSSTSNEVVGDSWIQLRPSAAQRGAPEFYRTLGFRTIIADTDELLDYLSNLELGSSTSPAANSGIDNIPSASEIALRPIEDYFGGAAPTWSDIYSGSLVRTSHFSELENRIAEKRSTIAAGIPGSGKTTLLMQLAAVVKFDGSKILLDGISESEANMLAQRISDKHALVLIDNVANDIGALRQFLACPNVVVIGAERDYALSSVSNLIRRLDIDIVGTTSIERRDEVRLWRSIPPRVRRGNHMIPPEVYSGATPSVFEIIQANVSEDPLGNRLAEYVEELRSEKVEQAEAVVLACYLQNCNVPVSIDVLISYFRNRVSDYRHVYMLMDSVGELLLEYSGDHRSEDQDYFIARSRIASEAVLNKVSRTILRDVLMHFHTNVSTARIPGFYVFKRRGYDAKLFARAFRAWKEGVDLYDRIVDRIEDNKTTTYILQQKALFLNQNNLHQDAFREIDLVRGRMHNTNWTIENSYYRILFDANYRGAANSEDALNQCKRAIRGIHQAYRGDDRKHQHAIAFTKLACRLAEIRRDDDIREFLTTANEMMKGLQATDSWLNAPKYLLRDVNLHLRGYGLAKG